MRNLVSFVAGCKMLSHFAPRWEADLCCLEKEKSRNKAVVFKFFLSQNIKCGGILPPQGSGFMIFELENEFRCESKVRGVLVLDE